MTRKPKRAMPVHNCRAAWYYEYPGSIEIVAELADADGNYIGTTTCRIYRSKLEDYIKYTAKPKKSARLTA